MSSHIATVRAAIAHALPYVIPTIANRIAKQTAPIVVKEANHWAKRAGIDYRIVSSVTKHRRKLARLREENMYYTPEELRHLQQRQTQRGPTPQQRMAGAGKEAYPPMVGPPTFQQAERATLFPGTVYRQFNGTPVTKEMYENMQRRATRARGRQYSANPCQVDPGPPPSAQDPNPRDATLGDDGYHIVEGSDPRRKPGAPAPYDPYEFVSDQYEFLGDNSNPEELAPPPPLPPIGPPEPSPAPYLSLPNPPPLPLPKLLRNATIQPKKLWNTKGTHFPGGTKKIFKKYGKKYKHGNIITEKEFINDPTYKPSKNTLKRLTETKEERSARLVASLEKARRGFVPPEALGPKQTLKEVIKERLGSTIPKEYFKDKN